VKRILILHAGGTIGMAAAPGSRALRPISKGSRFLELVPELKRIAQVDVTVLDNIDSSNVTPAHWARWFKVLKANYGRYDGFVITHGTDTMSYSAAALSFALARTIKPIVFTGSQRPLTNIRSDARDNMINAVEMACHGPKEVTVCFGNELLRGNRATKLSATDYIAFSSFNFQLLAKIGVNVEPLWRSLSKRDAVPAGRPIWKIEFSNKVFCFKIFPGISGEILRETVLDTSCEGVVLEAFGSGNVPSLDDSVLSMIRLAKKAGKPVVISSQCPHGEVDLEAYEPGVRARQAGAISAGDMTSEAAVVKLMHALGLGLKGARLEKYFLSNVCGERRPTGGMNESR
jgi:L-asparaginase